VTGDEGRTTPNVSDILKNKAKPIKLDVLDVIMEG
jgi:tRNA U54 and U55 pseudouridine synthase Pus10